MNKSSDSEPGAKAQARVSQNQQAWVLFGVALLTAVVGTYALNGLKTRGDRARRVMTCLTRVEDKAGELNAIEWSSFSEKTVPPELVSRLAKTRADLTEAYRKLMVLDAKAAALVDVNKRFNTYSELVDRRFTLLAAGNPQVAERFDKVSVAPAFESLRSAAETAGRSYDRLSSSILKDLEAGALLTLWFVVAAISGLVWQFGRHRRVLAAAASEQVAMNTAREQMERQLRGRSNESVAMAVKIADLVWYSDLAQLSSSVLRKHKDGLNNIQVASTLVLDRLKHSRLAELPHLTAMLHSHAEDVAEFLTNNPQGRQLPASLADIANALVAERAGVIEELDALNTNVQGMRELVERHLLLSDTPGVMERLPLTDALDDARLLTSDLLTRANVTLQGEVADGHCIVGERIKVVQILVNLFRNAAEAMVESGKQERVLTVRSQAHGDGRMQIQVSDTGPGVPSPDRERLFSFGFTTRKTGHGFGLYLSALAAKEMDGTLQVAAFEPGSGAKFTLDLPAQGLALPRQAA